MALSAADFRPRLERLLRAFGLEERFAGTPLVELGGRFAELVVKWNDRVDLTGTRDPDELVDLLFADAAAITAHAPRREGELWIDVGSGLGAPGVALALMNSEIRMTLVEPRARRVAFLRTLLHHLARPDIRVERRRSESFPDDSCDVAVSRATFAPPEWLKEGARLAREEVWVLLAQGAPPKNDAGHELRATIEFAWPLTEKPRAALRFVRVRKFNPP